MEENLRDGNSNDRTMKKKDGLGTKKLKKSLESSLNHFDSHADVAVEHGEKLKKNHVVVGSHDGKGKSISGMLAPAVPKKLWDGLLHLNSSITVSAVAFFKSGEKMPDVDWSDSIEVKGKVKLEAFEKFIQDLPRSRNRGLMVISLCWKEGSSSSGLADLKEVAKGYKEGGRVGIAQLSPGFDLYICPRSDTIITILAKHGFFKGMTAVEDNQDSLVGCVVWRRNQAPSVSAAKKSDKKISSSSKRPSNFASDSSNKRVDRKHLPRTELDNESVTTTSGTALYSNENRGNGNKNVETSEVHIALRGVSSSVGKFLPSMSVQSDSSSLSRSLGPSPCSPSTSLLGIGEQSLEMKTLAEELVRQKPKTNLEFQRHVYNLPPPIIETQVSTPDDDDLPEFDFGYSCGTSRTSISKTADAAVVDMVLSTDGMKEMTDILSKTMPTLQSPVSSESKVDVVNHLKIHPEAILKMVLLGKVVEADQVRAISMLEKNQSAESRKLEQPVDANANHQRKNLFDDDDDMPEWLPPDIDLSKPPVSGATRPSKILPRVLDLSSESFFHSPPSSRLPSQAKAQPLHVPFESQSFGCPTHGSATFSTKMTQPRSIEEYVKRGPTWKSHSSGPHLALPPKPFNHVNLPVQPTGGSWRP